MNTFDLLIFITAFAIILKHRDASTVIAPISQNSTTLADPSIYAYSGTFTIGASAISVFVRSIVASQELLLDFRQDGITAEEVIRSNKDMDSDKAQHLLNLVASLQARSKYNDLALHDFEDELQLSLIGYVFLSKHLRCPFSPGLYHSIEWVTTEYQNLHRRLTLHSCSCESPNMHLLCVRLEAHYIFALHLAYDHVRKLLDDAEDIMDNALTFLVDLEELYTILVDLNSLRNGPTSARRMDHVLKQTIEVFELSIEHLTKARVFMAETSCPVDEIVQSHDKEIVALAEGKLKVFAGGTKGTNTTEGTNMKCVVQELHPMDSAMNNICTGVAYLFFDGMTLRREREIGN